MAGSCSVGQILLVRSRLTPDLDSTHDFGTRLCPFTSINVEIGPPGSGAAGPRVSRHVRHDRRGGSPMPATAHTATSTIAPTRWRRRWEDGRKRGGGLALRTGAASGRGVGGIGCVRSLNQTCRRVDWLTMICCSGCSRRDALEGFTVIVRIGSPGSVGDVDSRSRAPMKFQGSSPFVFLEAGTVVKCTPSQNRGGRIEQRSALARARPVAQPIDLGASGMAASTCSRIGAFQSPTVSPTCDSPRFEFSALAIGGGATSSVGRRPPIGLTLLGELAEALPTIAAFEGDLIVGPIPGVLERLPVGTRPPLPVPRPCLLRRAAYDRPSRTRDQHAGRSSSA